MNIDNIYSLQKCFTTFLQYTDTYLYEPASDNFVAFIYRTPGGTIIYLLLQIKQSQLICFIVSKQTKIVSLLIILTLNYSDWATMFFHYVAT